MSTENEKIPNDECSDPAVYDDNVNSNIAIDETTDIKPVEQLSIDESQSDIPSTGATSDVQHNESDMVTDNKSPSASEPEQSGQLVSGESILASEKVPSCEPVRSNEPEPVSAPALGKLVPNNEPEPASELLPSASDPVPSSEIVTTEAPSKITVAEKDSKSVIESDLPDCQQMDTEPVVQKEEDMEDGELSDGQIEEDGHGTSSTEGVTDSQATGDISTNTSSTDQTNEMPAPAVPTKRSRKSTESSDDQGNSHSKEAESSGSSSSSEEESRSERKRRKKEKERRRKEKKQKRKREKQEKKKRKKQRATEDYDDPKSSRSTYDHPEYRMYDDRWREGGNSLRSPPLNRGGSYADEDRYEGYSGYGGSNGRSPPGPYDSPAPDPYASPPDDSSEDEFSETLYSLVGDELMDPSVSAAEKEALFQKSRDKIPGLSAGKLKKIMKQKQYRERQQMRQRQRNDYRGGRRDRRDEMPEKTVKCRYYAEGKCQKGERCQFSHNFIPAKKMEACKFFLQGYCAKGDMCIYLHSEVPCKYYHTGQKCFNAEKCKFSHEPLSDSTRPLLEKAILLEETGTFKAERPSLLGSPPKDLHQNKAPNDANTDRPKVSSFDPSDDERESADTDSDMREGMPPPPRQSHIPSIFDLDLTPSADMVAKLEAGLYDELTAPLSDSEEDRFDSPPKRPHSFYSDTLSTPDRSERGFPSGESPKTKRNRWGPDLPAHSMPTDQYSNQGIGGYGSNYSNGGGDADRLVGKKGPLLPIPQPGMGAPSQSTNMPPPVSDNVQAVAAANLSKLLNVLRSNAVAATRPMSDPRAGGDPRAMSDPRAGGDPRAMSDPRAGGDPRAMSDPRAGGDPRAMTSVVDPRVRSGSLPDPRGAATVDPRTGMASNGAVGNNIGVSKPQHVMGSLLTPIKRPVPELNGKFTRPMEFNLIPVYVELRTTYIPPGAENSQEMLRDPRIKKRVLSMKKDGPVAPPSLPDITADLQRLQNARLMSNAAPVVNTRLSNNNNRVSVDSSVSDPRRNSLDKQSVRGQGDQNTQHEVSIDTVNRPRNATRTALSKVNPMSSSFNLGSSAATSYDEEEEEDNSLTIDMVEDDSKLPNRTLESAYT